MNIRIESLHFTASETLESFVNEKVIKLDRFGKKFLHADVVLGIDRAKDGRNKKCEIKIAMPGNLLVAKCNNETFEAAVMNAIDAIENQLRKTIP